MLIFLAQFVDERFVGRLDSLTRFHLETEYSGQALPTKGKISDCLYN